MERERKREKRGCPLFSPFSFAAQARKKKPRNPKKENKKKKNSPEPTTDPAGSSASDVTPGAQISASRTSSRGRLHGSTVPLGR